MSLTTGLAVARAIFRWFNPKLIVRRIMCRLFFVNLAKFSAKYHGRGRRWDLFCGQLNPKKEDRRAYCAEHAVRVIFLNSGIESGPG